MRDQQGGDAVGVALLDDQFDDGGRGDRIEAAGGRVVEQQLGLADDGAGDGHAAAHSPRKAGREEIEGLLQFNKAQGVADAAVDLLVGNPLLDQLEGHIVADGERVEERALLEDHAGAGAQVKKLLLGQGGDLLAEEPDAAPVGAQQAVGQLEQHALAHSRGAEQNARFSGPDGETDVHEHRRAVEGDRDVAEFHHREGLGGR